MKMSTATKPRVELENFLDLILAWHCCANVPLTRVEIAMFIEDLDFADFLQVVNHWCSELGLACPTRTDVVKTLNQMYGTD